MNFLSVTEAARGFSDLISRIRYRGESVTLVKGGKPVARLTPLPERCTGRELAEAWRDMPHLSVKEADAFHKELTASRAKLRLTAPRWD